MNFVTDAQLRQWLASKLAEFTVIAPAQAAQDLVLYRAVDTIEDIAFDFARTAVSPKQFFLPDTEAILTVERVKRLAAGEEASGPQWDVKLGEPELARDQLLFGIRPCDVHALQSLDALLLREPVDTYYARRRQRTTLVGLACQEMGPSCFCTSLGFNGDDSAGMDVMLWQVDGGYLVEVLTDKGKVAAANMASSPHDGGRSERVWPEALTHVAPRQVWTSLFNDPYWGQLADRCLSCKICSYVCPTCRCFDVRDYTVAQGPGYEKIERLRCWDSCMSNGYRTIAGGHNPRPTKATRLRNRFQCKFNYYPEDFGEMGCVGCGRCVEYCPVNVDITEVLAEMAGREPMPAVD